MKITVADWMGGSQLNGAPYAHNQVVEGDKEKARDMAWELFEFGRNVMISRSSEPDSIFIFVDTRRFTQR